MMIISMPLLAIFTGNNATMETYEYIRRERVFSFLKWVA